MMAEMSGAERGQSKRILSPKYHIIGEITDREKMLYVERPFDREFKDLIRISIDTCVPMLHGTRQVGKTSLVLSTMAEVSARATKCCRVDLADCGGQFTYDVGRPTTNFIVGLAMLVSEQLNLLDEFEAFIRPYDIGNNRLFLDAKFLERFFCDVVAKNLEERVIFFLDEVDTIRHFSGALELLTKFLVKTLNHEKFTRIRFVLIGLNNVANLIPDKKAKVEIYNPQPIPDFSPEDDIIDALARGLSHIESNSQRRKICKEAIRFTGGQPYLTSYLLLECVNSKIKNITDLKRLEKELVSVAKRQTHGRFNGIRVHFDQPERVFTEDYPKQRGNAFIAYQEVLDTGSASRMERLSHACMQATGLVALKHNDYVPRSPVYSKFFDREWLHDIRYRMLRKEALETDVVDNSDLPRVLLANVGGTLGMDVDANGDLVEPDDPQKFFDDMTDLTNLIRPVVQPAISSPTDGANITPKNWVAIAELIHRYRDEDISGVVVAMGTDTMAYAASAVAYALGQKLKFPVVFTGSQAPNNKVHADARANLLRAALVAREGRRLPEVVIAFNDEVMRAVRSEKVDDFRFKAFDAPSEGALAIVGQTLQYQLEPREIPDDGKDWKLAAKFEERILKVSQYPGMRPELISSILESGEVKGLMIESLGLGNIPVVKGYDLLPVIKEAVDLNIPVLISGRYPIMPEFTHNYSPARAPLVAGAISAGDMAPPAALTKFMWAIAQVDEEIAQGTTKEPEKIARITKIIQTNLLGEISRTAQVPR